MDKYYCPVCMSVVAWIKGKPEVGVRCGKCGTWLSLEELLDQWKSKGAGGDG